MANNIKGITVEIGGNTGPLTTALKGVNKTAGDLQSELKEVNKQLKFDPGNTELLKQKQDLLKQSTQALEEKQKTLKTAVDQAHEAFDNGDLGADKVRAVEREYEKVTSQLKDTKQELSNVQSSVGTFSDKVKAKFSSIKESIKSAFSAENIKTALGAVGVAVGSFLQSSISKSGEAEEINKNLEQTIESTGGAAGMTAEQMGELAEQLQATTTFSADNVKEGEAMLATFTNIGQDVFPLATSAALDYAQKMGVDAKSAALTLGKALNDPVDGLSKLTKSGVTFTDQQKEQITAMQEAGDTAGAQKLMLQELNKEFGGQAAAAADTYAGKQEQIKNQLDEVQETIGAALIPVLQQIMTAVTPIIQSIAQFVSEHPKVTAGILAAVAVIGTLVGGMSLANTVLGIFNGVLGASAVATAAEGTAAAGASVGIWAMLAPILLVVAAIAAVAVGVVLVIKNWSQIKTFFIDLWSGIKSVFSGIGDWFKEKFEGAKDGVQNAWSGMTSWFSNLWSSISSGVTNGFNGLKTGINTAMNAVKSGLTTAWNGITGAVNAIVRPLVNGILDFWNAIKPGLSKIMTGIQNMFSGAWTIIKTIVLGPVLLICDLVTGNFGKLKTDLQGIWTNIQTGAKQVWSGIQQYFSGILDVIIGVFTTTWSHITTNITVAWDGIKTFFTQTWAAIGTGLENAWNSFLTTITKLCGNIKTGIINIWNSVITWFKGLPHTLLVIGSNMFTSMKTGVESTIDSVTDAVKTGLNAAIDWIKSLPSEALQWGKDIINGIVNGIKSAASAVSEAVEGVAENIRSFLHFSKPDEGPLADFDTYMPDMMSLLAAGIKNNISKVSTAAKEVAAAMAASIPTTWDSSVQVRTALATAYGGGSVSSNVSQNTGSSQLNTETVKGIVNGLAAVMGSQFGTISIQPSKVNIDGKAVGEITYEIHKNIARQKGE